MNKKGEKCIRPEERDEVLQTKGNARELFERGGRVNKDTEETENEMVGRKKSTNGAKRDSSARCSASRFSFSFFSFFAPRRPRPSVLRLRVHFLAEKSHNTTRAHLVVSVDECETNHVNCIKKNTASEHGPGNLRSLGRKKRWRKTAEVLRLPQAAVSHRRTVRLGSSLGLMLAEWAMAVYTIAGRRRTSITAHVCADDAIK